MLAARAINNDDRVPIVKIECNSAQSGQPEYEIQEGRIALVRATSQLYCCA